MNKFEFDDHDLTVVQLKPEDAWILASDLAALLDSGCVEPEPETVQAIIILGNEIARWKRNHTLNRLDAQR